MITRLQGPISVAFTEEEGQCHATALQFDLVGVGKTREAAFAELQDLFKSYIYAVLSRPGKVQFLFPSEPDEWNNPDVECYSVMIEIQGKSPSEAVPAQSKLEDLRRFRRQIRGVQLQSGYC